MKKEFIRCKEDLPISISVRLWNFKDGGQKQDFCLMPDSLHIRHVSNLEICVEFCLLTVQLIILIQSDH